MSNPAPFAPIAELLERSLGIRHVYGEPVHQGEITVIPVAQVAFGFGAGGGSGPGRRWNGGTDANPPNGAPHEGEGAGGGGGVRMTPVGLIEIGPEGTRFIQFHPLRRWLAAGAVGLVAGLLIARRWGA